LAENKETFAEKRGEFIEKRDELLGVLTAISVVSRKLAKELAALEFGHDEIISEKAERRDND